MPRTEATTALPRAESPAAPTHHRHDIQGLRGLAVLVVVLFHAGTFVGGGFIGVDVFFVISGFVITLSLLRELDRSGTIGLRSFYVRRIRRLLPALGLVILAVLLVSISQLDPAGGRQAVTDTARAASLFVANFHLESVGGGYFAPAAERNPLLHTWSLSIEEQFYAFLPPLMVGAWALGRRRGRSRQWLLLAVWAVTLVSFAWSVQVVSAGDLRAAFYFPHLRAWEFGVGALLALHAPLLARMGRSTAASVSAAGALAVLASAVALSGSTTFPGPTALVPVAGAAMVIAGGTVAGVTTPGLHAAWLVWLGDRSYSWYLWHWPLLTFAFIRWPDIGWIRLAAAGAALVPAALSYAWVEEPIRRNRRIVGSAALALAAVVVAVPVATAAVVEDAADAELTRRAPELDELSAVWVSGCDERPWPSERCTFGPADASGTLALIGDSHASMLGDVVIHVGAQLDLRTAAFTKAGCAAALVPLPTDTAGCRAWLDETVERIRALDPDVVVVANRSPLYVLGRVEADTSGRRPIAARPDEALTLWEQGLRTLFEELDAPVLLIQTAPEQPGAVADLIGTAVDDGDVPALPVEAHEERAGAINRVEAAVVAEVADVARFDPATVLCSDVCTPHVDGTWRYFDGNHLTPRATLLFADDIRAQLRRLLSGELSDGNS